MSQLIDRDFWHYLRLHYFDAQTCRHNPRLCFIPSIRAFGWWIDSFRVPEVSLPVMMPQKGVLLLPENDLNSARTAFPFLRAHNWGAFRLDNRRFSGQLILEPFHLTRVGYDDLLPPTPRDLALEIRANGDLVASFHCGHPQILFETLPVHAETFHILAPEPIQKIDIGQLTDASTMMEKALHHGDIEGYQKILDLYPTPPQDPATSRLLRYHYHLARELGQHYVHANQIVSLIADKLAGVKPKQWPANDEHRRTGKKPSMATILRLEL